MALARNTIVLQSTLFILMFGSFIFAGTYALGLVLSLGAAYALSRAVSERLPFDRWDLLLALWLLWLPLTQFFSHAPSQGTVQLWGLMLFPLTFLAWRRLHDPKQSWQALRPLLGLCAIGLAAWGLLEETGARYTGKIDGPFIDPNLYAAALNLLWLPLTARYLADERSAVHRRLAGLAMFFAVALAFFLAASRGATLVALLLFPLIAWQCRQAAGFRWRLTAWLAAVGAAYLAALAWVPEDALSRLAGTLQSGDSARLMLWQATLSLIHDSPWTGIGLGGFSSAYPLIRPAEEFSTSGLWAHNDYLQILLEGGAVSLLFFLGFFALFGWLALEALRSRAPLNTRAEQLGLACGGLALYLHAGVNFILYFAFANLFLGLYLARLLHLRGQASPHGSPLAIKPYLAHSGLALLALIAVIQLVGLLGIQSFLVGSRPGLQALQILGVNPNSYTVASNLALLAPSATTPRYAMALQMTLVLDDGGTSKVELDREAFRLALANYEAARALAPCHVSFGIAEADFLLRHGRLAPARTAHEQALLTLQKNLGCNPRHGLSLYFAAEHMKILGRLDEARAVLNSGITQVIHGPEKLLLQTSLLGLERPGLSAATAGLSAAIAGQLQHSEERMQSLGLNPFWLDMQQQYEALLRTTG